MPNTLGVHKIKVITPTGTGTAVLYNDRVHTSPAWLSHMRGMHLKHAIHFCRIKNWSIEFMDKGNRIIPGPFAQPLKETKR